MRTLIIGLIVVMAITVFMVPCIGLDNCDPREIIRVDGVLYINLGKCGRGLGFTGGAEDSETYYTLFREDGTLSENPVFYKKKLLMRYRDKEYVSPCPMIYQDLHKGLWAAFVPAEFTMKSLGFKPGFGSSYSDSSGKKFACVSFGKRREFKITHVSGAPEAGSVTKSVYEKPDNVAIPKFICFDATDIKRGILQGYCDPGVSFREFPRKDYKLTVFIIGDDEFRRVKSGKDSYFQMKKDSDWSIESSLLANATRITVMVLKADFINTNKKGEYSSSYYHHELANAVVAGMIVLKK